MVIVSSAYCDIIVRVLSRAEESQFVVNFLSVRNIGRFIFSEQGIKI